MGVVNKQFELSKFVFEISLTFTAGSVCLCGVCSYVVVLGLSMRLSWYPMLWVRLFAVTVMYVLLFVLHVCFLQG